MFRGLRNRLLRRTREFSARNAAEGTCEAIRLAVIYARPTTALAAEQQVLDALGKRRAWTRLDSSTFECRFSGRSYRIVAPEPFDANELFRRIATAEIEVFLGDCDPETLADMHAIAQGEIKRLVERDSAKA